MASLTGDELLELQDWLPAIAEVLRQLPTDPPFRPCDKLKVIKVLSRAGWHEFTKWQGASFTHTGKELKYFQEPWRPWPYEVAGFAVVHLTDKGTELVVDGDGQWDRLTSRAAHVDLAADGAKLTTGCAEHGPHYQWARHGAPSSLLLDLASPQDSAPTAA